VNGNGHYVYAGGWLKGVDQQALVLYAMFTRSVKMKRGQRCRLALRHEEFRKPETPLGRNYFD